MIGHAWHQYWSWTGGNIEHHTGRPHPDAPDSESEAK